MDIFVAIARADDLYRRRGEHGAVRESVRLLIGLSDHAERYEAQWRLARALFFLGQEAESKNARRQLHAAGAGAGEQALSLDGSRVEGFFWTGVNLALFAESSSGLKAAQALLRARRRLNRAAAISDSFHGAGPLRVLGRIAHRAPRIVGGSRRKALDHLERARAIAPTNSVTLIYLAELLLDLHETERAKEALRVILSTEIDPEWEFENIRDRQLAASLLSRLSPSAPQARN